MVKTFPHTTEQQLKKARKQLKADSWTTLKGILGILRKSNNLSIEEFREYMANTFALPLTSALNQSCSRMVYGGTEFVHHRQIESRGQV